MSQAKEIQRTFEFKNNPQSMKPSFVATIIFKKEHDNFVFGKCEYNCLGSYDLDAWIFLGELSQEIQRLNAELNK